jgi:sulfate adenylyltransferase (ADP) / ATP adenylyltransferase
MLTRVRAASAAARETGALVSFETKHEVVRHVCHGSTAVGIALPDQEILFLVRTVQNFAQKDAAAAGRSDPVAPAPPKPLLAADFNPFLPYDPAMFVQELPPSHVLLLNKFNVVDNHTLIVTKQFEEQSSLLTARDFTAMWSCLHSEMDGLAFYNAGKIAGASQRHKHLQVVPCPLRSDEDYGQSRSTRTPFDTIFENCVEEGGPCSYSPYLPFLHGVVCMDDCSALPPAEAGELTMSKYMGLVRSLSMDVEFFQQSANAGPQTVASRDEGQFGRQPFAYNLLVTRKFMWMVPRSQECFEDKNSCVGKISVNSLGFAGCLLVRDLQQLEQVRLSPMRVLEQTTFPTSVRGMPQQSQ